MRSTRVAALAAAVLAGLAVVPGSAAAPAPPPAPAETAFAGDFDGDGVDDVYFAAPGTAHERLSFGSATGTFATEDVVWNGTYRPLVGDFDGDGRDDVFHYGPGRARDAVWYAGADRGMTHVAADVRGTYEPVVGDFDGDGREDIFWYAPGRVADFIWYGRSGRTFRTNPARADLTATPAVGDFDADGKSDIRWYTSSARRDVVWYAGGDGTFETAAVSSPASGYRPVVADFDGEGTDDVLWYRTRSGGTSFVELGSRLRTPRQVDADLPSAGTTTVGDFNGDLLADVLVTGSRSAVAYGSPAGAFVSVSVQPPSRQHPVAGDFDGDLDDDVYWAGEGRDVIWRGDPLRRFTGSGVTVRQNRVPALDPAVWATQYKPYGYIAHAMGGVNGHAYTNSLEAFKHNYAAGFRVFEVDFITLKDGTILAMHDGVESALGLKKHFRDTTYAEIRGRKLGGKFTVLTGADVLALMRDYRDVYIVLDTKWNREEISRRMLTAASGDPQVARRVLPHVAGQADLDVLRRYYPLQHYVVALYRTQIYGRFENDAVLAFVRKNRAPAVMMWIKTRDRTKSLAWNGRAGRRYEAAFTDALHAAGAVTYVHSTGDGEAMRPFADRRVGVYSDGPLGPEGPVANPLDGGLLADLLGDAVA